MTRELPMKIKVVVHEAEEGGYWAEVPSIPGCATQGESFEELLANLYEAVKGCLSVDVQDVVVSGKGVNMFTCAISASDIHNAPSRLGLFTLHVEAPPLRSHKVG